MTRFLEPDEAAIDAAAESRTKRGRDRVACFLHLRSCLSAPQSGVDRCHCVHAVARSGGDRSEGHARETTSLRLAEARARAEGWLEAAR
jgi:hypothetical protein